MIEQSLYMVPDNLAKDEFFKLSVMRIAAELTSFYKKWKTDNPDSQLTEIQTFVGGMIGTEQSPCLRTKASETKGFLYFLVDALSSLVSRMEKGTLWLRGALGLKRLIEKLANTPLVVPPADHQECWWCAFP